MAVVALQLRALPLEEALPVVLGRYDGRLVVGGLRLLVGHLQEEQERDLLRVGHVGEPVVPEDVGEIPGLVDDLLGGVGGHGLLITQCE